MAKGSAGHFEGNSDRDGRLRMPAGRCGEMPRRRARTGTDAGRAPRIVAAAYTYNKENEKITTNYALDARSASLVIQGSIEGATPVVSPNTGRLRTVGPLGAGGFEQASFDISDLTNTGFAALTRDGASGSQWYVIDLASGKATALGAIGIRETVVGIAIEP